MSPFRTELIVTPYASSREAYGLLIRSSRSLARAHIQLSGPIRLAPTVCSHPKCVRRQVLYDRGASELGKFSPDLTSPRLTAMSHPTTLKEWLYRAILDLLAV